MVNNVRKTFQKNNIVVFYYCFYHISTTQSLKRQNQLSVIKNFSITDDYLLWNAHVVGFYHLIVYHSVVSWNIITCVLLIVWGSTLGFVRCGMIAYETFHMISNKEVLCATVWPTTMMYTYKCSYFLQCSMNDVWFDNRLLV